MHRKIMRFMVDFSLVIGIILAFIIAWMVGKLVNNSGFGILVFIITLVIIEMGLASEGMKVEQAENIAKIAYNTEQLINIQQGKKPASPTYYDPTSMLSRAAAEGPVTVNRVSYDNSASQPVSRPVQTQVPPAGPSKWTCKRCFEENSADAHYCINCGNKKSY